MAEDVNTEYDFSSKDPGSILTEDELRNFEKGMKLTNSSINAGTVNFGKAVQYVKSELNELFA
jgi:hypothetical protein